MSVVRSRQAYLKEEPSGGENVSFVYGMVDIKDQKGQGSREKIDLGLFLLPRS